MVSTRSRSTVKPPQNPLASTCRRRHTTVSSRGSATRGRGSGQSRRGGGATNRAAHTSQQNPSPTPTDDAAQEHNKNSPTRNDERDESAHNQYNDNGDTEEFVDNGENDESEEMEPEDIGLTLANFESRLSAWTIPALRQTWPKEKEIPIGSLQKSKRFSTTKRLNTQR
ncbi:hypothetical protein PCASD_22705 [Puccinia coronata f. sp. avenae]|uniref:Uncharacterized protein n=1 Tax=Puccinia coronata f. sp. avenae TaxID=200324 RepID=A0A2N5TTB7_9BASI|nr:hypothetical protein PCASD_22705 [Puccinia coronata f. sp. avenae]